MLALGIVFMALWLVFIAYGYWTGFRVQEVRRWGRVIASGREARRFGVFLMVVGVLFLVADFVLMILFSGLLQ